MYFLGELTHEIVNCLYLTVLINAVPLEGDMTTVGLSLFAAGGTQLGLEKGGVEREATVRELPWDWG